MQDIETQTRSKQIIAQATNHIYQIEVEIESARRAARQKLIVGIIFLAISLATTIYLVGSMIWM